MHHCITGIGIDKVLQLIILADYTSYNSILRFSYTTIVAFTINTAGFGGALDLNIHSFIRLQGDADCIVMFNNNTATQDGAATYSFTKTLSYI